MGLIQLVYASKANHLGENVIQDILSTARNSNPKESLSGILLFNSKYFLQCLEGDRRAVNSLYLRIAGDRRHSDPTILLYRGIDARSFADWSMAYVGEGTLNREAFFKYTPRGEFNPYELSSAGAIGLLEDLKARAV